MCILNNGLTYINCDGAFHEQAISQHKNTDYMLN